MYRDDISEIKDLIKLLLKKYNASHALLFGSYARGEATADSDIDVVVFGGENFKARDIFAFGEDLRTLSGKDVDVFEIREINKNTDFYKSIIRDGVKVA